MFNDLRIRQSAHQTSRAPAGRFLLALGMLITLTACGGATADSRANKAATPLLEVSNAKVRGLLPGRNMTAAYFTLQNNRPSAVTLIGAKSASAGRVEMHTVEMVAEQMRMRPLTEVLIENGQSATFISGGHHLMLFDVADIQASMAIILQFSDGTELPVKFSKVDIAGGGH